MWAKESYQQRGATAPAAAEVYHNGTVAEPSPPTGWLHKASYDFTNQGPRALHQTTWRHILQRGELLCMMSDVSGIFGMFKPCVSGLCKAETGRGARLNATAAIDGRGHDILCRLANLVFDVWLSLNTRES